MGSRGRGGARQGVTGKAYANRTDMNGANVVGPQGQNLNAGKIAATAVPGQPYGAAGAQLAAQKAVPMAATPSPVQAAPVASPAQQGAPAPQGAPQAPIVPLNAPTTHGLPVTTGVGGNTPGAGPEVLAPTFNSNLQMQALNLLNQLGDNISPHVMMIKNTLQAGANNGLMQ
jgi:hypothetical protein